MKEIDLGNYVLYIDKKKSFAGNAFFNKPGNSTKQYELLCSAINQKLNKDYYDQNGKGKRVWGRLNENDIQTLESFALSFRSKEKLESENVKSSDFLINHNGASETDDPDHLDFIIFAVEQAKEAEKFGFTRNECCQNLKTALQQHWQHKTMGLASQSQKKNIQRSKAAKGMELKDCEVEHIVPQMEIVNMLMNMDPLNKTEVENVLKKYFKVLLVTKEEHKNLNASGLRSKMPDNWDQKNIWARYSSVGIEPEKGYH
jgi:hypothetical protein